MESRRAAAVMAVDLFKEKAALNNEHKLKGECLEELLSGITPIERLVKRANFMGYERNNKELKINSGGNIML
jgi:hypothetical protein